MGVGSFSIYDKAHPVKAPDRSTAARDAAVTLENSIRHDSNETGAFVAFNGKVLIRKMGNLNNVTFSNAELAGTTGTLFTHNHPDDGTFSRDDVVAAIRTGEIMTDQDISKFMARLNEEDEMLKRDGVRSFDGSLAWKEMTRQLAEDALSASERKQNEPSGI